MLDPYSEKPWLKFYDAHVRPSLEYPQKTFAEIYREATVDIPDTIAVYYMGKGISYQALEESANKFAHFLRQSGLNPGDIVGSWQAEMPDGPQTIVVRSDSTASFGEEIVQLRLAADTIYVLFGDEWVGYRFELSGETLILSGGDLVEPITLKRVRTESRGRTNRGDIVMLGRRLWKVALD